MTDQSTVGPAVAAGWAPGAKLVSLEPWTLTRVDIARFAAAVADFNPIHIDEEFATSAGFPSVIAHGPLTLSLFAQILGHNFGAEKVRAVEAQFRSPALPGHPVRVEGTVAEILVDGAESVVRCELAASQDNGRIVATGGGRAVISGV